jgi:hypothetical protein
MHLKALRPLIPELPRSLKSDRTGPRYSSFYKWHYYHKSRSLNNEEVYKSVSNGNSIQPNNTGVDLFDNPMSALSETSAVAKFQLG